MKPPPCFPCARETCLAMLFSCLTKTVFQTRMNWRNTSITLLSRKGFKRCALRISVVLKTFPDFWVHSPPFKLQHHTLRTVCSAVTLHIVAAAYLALSHLIRCSWAFSSLSLIAQSLPKDLDTWIYQPLFSLLHIARQHLLRVEVHRLSASYSTSLRTKNQTEGLDSRPLDFRSFHNTANSGS